MGIADVQRAFNRGLDGKGSCKAATIDLENGGREQRLSFHVISSSYGAAYLSEAIPVDMCPMQHARHMATEFLMGRYTGNSRLETQPLLTQPILTLTQPILTLTQQIPTFTQPVPTQEPTQTVLANPPATLDVVVSQPRGQTMAPTLTTVQEPPQAREPEPAQTTDDQDAEALCDLIEAGNHGGVVDLLCAMVDKDAGDVRNMWTTTSAGQWLEYEQVRREINDLAYQLVEPTPAACPCLWASVGAEVRKTGDDAADIRAAARLINQSIDGTNAALARVRFVRLKAKADLRAATSIEEAVRLYQAIDWPVS